MAPPTMSENPRRLTCAGHTAPGDSLGEPRPPQRSSLHPENTRSVKISYFGASTHMALGVALLLAAAGGALLIAAVGTLRITRVPPPQKSASAVRNNTTARAPHFPDPRLVSM